MTLVIFCLVADAESGDLDEEASLASSTTSSVAMAPCIPVTSASPEEDWDDEIDQDRPYSKYLTNIDQDRPYISEI